MVLTNLLDQLVYPWHEPTAQELYSTLMTLHPSGQSALLLARRAQVDTSYILEQQAIAPLWQAILDTTAAAHRLRSLVQDVHDRLLPDHPARPFLAALLEGRTPATSGAPVTVDGSPGFLYEDNSVGEFEALLFHDDLTMSVGRIPALIATLQRLVPIAPAVGKVNVTFNGGEQYGTAFRMGPDLLLTNWHVVHRQSDGGPATNVSVEFGFEDDSTGHPLVAQPVRCEAAPAAQDKDDDWALLRAVDPLKPEWTMLKLSEAAEPSLQGAAFIIQHPKGQRKRVGFIRNQVSYVDDRVVHYLTDTDVGSSGAPVMDEQGSLIALHHRGGRPQEVLGKPPLRKNEGIRISRVVAGLRKQGVEVS